MNSINKNKPLPLFFTNEYRYWIFSNKKLWVCIYCSKRIIDFESRCEKCKLKVWEIDFEKSVNLKDGNSNPFIKYIEDEKHIRLLITTLSISFYSSYRNKSNGLKHGLNYKELRRNDVSFIFAKKTKSFYKFTNSKGFGKNDIDFKKRYSGPNTKLEEKKIIALKPKDLVENISRVVFDHRNLNYMFLGEIELFFAALKKHLNINDKLQSIENAITEGYLLQKLKIDWNYNHNDFQCLVEFYNHFGLKSIKSSWDVDALKNFGFERINLIDVLGKKKFNNLNKAFFKIYSDIDDPSDKAKFMFLTIIERDINKFKKIYNEIDWSSGYNYSALKNFRKKWNILSYNQNFNDLLKNRLLKYMKNNRNYNLYDLGINLNKAFENRDLIKHLKDCSYCKEKKLSWKNWLIHLNNVEKESFKLMERELVIEDTNYILINSWRSLSETAIALNNCLENYFTTFTSYEKNAFFKVLDNSNEKIIGAIRLLKIGDTWKIAEQKSKNNKEFSVQMLSRNKKFLKSVNELKFKIDLDHCI